MAERPPATHTSRAIAPPREQTQLTTIVYLLQALALINGLTAVAGLFINYLKLEQVRGTWLESHFRWQIRTFWYALAWLLLGTILAMVLIGYVILIAATVWYIYRIVRGWLALADRAAIRVDR